MSVKDLAPALIAVGQLFDAANSVLNRDAAKVDIHVRATSEGSFEVDLELIQTAYQKVVSLLSGDDVTAALQLRELLLWGSGGAATVIGSLIVLIKKLRGKSADKVETAEDGTLKITLGSETILQVNAKVWELYNDQNVRRQLRGLIGDPLTKDGIDSFEVRDGGEVRTSVSKAEAEFFDGDSSEDVLVDTVQEVAYSIVSLSFKRGNKWRLFDGSSTISADIIDNAFLDRVADRNELFGDGDMLVCRVRIRQTEGGPRGLRVTHTIEHVLEHRRAAQQTEMGLAPSRPEPDTLRSPPDMEFLPSPTDPDERK